MLYEESSVEPVVENISEATSATNMNEQPETAQLSLNDRISSATIENHQDLLAEIAAEQNPIIRESLAVQLAKVLGINKQTVLKALQKLALTDELDRFASELTAMRPMKALFPGLVDLVDNDGKVAFLVKNGNVLEVADTWKDSSGNSYCPPDRKYFKFNLPEAERVIGHYADKNDNQLFKDLIEFCPRFSYLEADVWPIIVLSIFLSYLQDHADVRYLPVIYFYAVAERGKSRTAKTMLATSYRGQHLVDIRPANIVRFAENFGATIFFDVTDLWKSAEKSDGTDILLGRFEKGSQIVRVLNPDKGPFADQTYFNVYGSTIVATNEPANITFESRCLSITMPNVPGKYENLSPEMGVPLKERLTAFRARMMNTPLPVVEPIAGITGRLWDISEPLFRLAAVVAPEAIEPMKRVILEMAGHKVEDKKESVEGLLVSAIDHLADFDGILPIEISVEEIRIILNKDKAERFHISPQKLGKRIQSLSLKTKAVNGRARLVITAKELNVLKEQYGLSVVPMPGGTLPLATTPAASDNYDAESCRESLANPDYDESKSAYLDLIDADAEDQRRAKIRKQFEDRIEAGNLRRANEMAERHCISKK
jgi:hypothetical protein